jgi:hypothetical protein
MNIKAILKNIVKRQGKISPKMGNNQEFLEVPFILFNKRLINVQKNDASKISVV